MDPFQFVCPHCATRLRIREKLLLGRQIACPECRGALLIVKNGDALAVERVAGARPSEGDRTQPRRAPPGRDGGKQPRAAGPAAATAIAQQSSGTMRPAAQEAPSSAGLPPAAGAQVVWWRRPLVLAWTGAGVCAAALAWYALVGVLNRDSHHTTTAQGSAEDAQP